MIAARRLQRSFADGLIAEEVRDLWEPWMRHADEALNDDRLLEIAGRRMRVDTTVVETNIHYPTDSTLMGDGVRVLTRVMKKATAVAGKAGEKFRDRSRSVKRRILEIAYAARNKSEKGQQKMKAAYGKLLEATSRVVGQAKKFSAAIDGHAAQNIQKAKQQLDEMIPRLQRVMKQARERVLRGNTRAENKILSMFEPDTEVIRKGKASKPTEFGKMVKIQEAENQIVIHCEVFDERPSDSDLLTPSIEKHKELLNRVPDLTAADAGFFSAANEVAAKHLGVKRVTVPSRSTKSQKRKQEQKKRWFKDAQKWRTGCEGRISILKRRHGLNRSLYKCGPLVRTRHLAQLPQKSSPPKSLFGVEERWTI